ncbi:MAG TPA: transporter substrate-binding domain-containing protein [Casimicrobiaceae bacterium]|jgi:ABC-type amino acid transport substrate-binding protein|nr:transporter substrate-binding domain-containing protein [Casimicrobiaceae bacterium]
MTENIMPQIPGEYLSPGPYWLPRAETATDKTHWIQCTLPRFGSVRITYERMTHKRGRTCSWFWTPVSAEHSPGKVNGEPLFDRVPGAHPVKQTMRTPRKSPLSYHYSRKFAAIWLLLVVACLALGVPRVNAQDAAQRKALRVAVKPIAPFVLKRGTELTGFSVDLWNALAQRLRIDTVWVEVKTVDDQLQAVKSGEADVAIAAITITKEREKAVDFTQPYFDSGLQILVRAQRSNQLVDAFDSVPWITVATLLGVFIAIMFVMANVLWIVERRTSRHFQKGYLKGMGEGLWGVALIVATGEHGDRQAARIVKRLIVFLMWLVGVVLIAQLTATVTSVQTVDRLNTNIRGPEDLGGKIIATVPGTVAADYLTEHGLRYVEAATGDDGYKLLLQGRVQAMVFDAPTLQYWSARRGNGSLRVVGPMFAPEKYGIAVADGSRLRKQINGALLQMYEDGQYEELYKRWFSRG